MDDATGGGAGDHPQMRPSPFLVHGEEWFAVLGGSKVKAGDLGIMALPQGEATGLLRCVEGVYAVVSPVLAGDAYSVVQLSSQQTFARIVLDNAKETLTWGAAEGPLFAAATLRDVRWITQHSVDTQITNTDECGRVVFCGEIKRWHGAAVARVSTRSGRLAWQCSSFEAQAWTWQWPDSAVEWPRLQQLRIQDDFVAVLEFSNSLEVWNRASPSHPPNLQCRLLCPRSFGAIVSSLSWLDGAAVLARDAAGKSTVGIYNAVLDEVKPQTLHGFETPTRKNQILAFDLDDLGRLHVWDSGHSETVRIFNLSEMRETTANEASHSIPVTTSSQCTGRDAIVQALVHRVHSAELSLSQSRESLSRRTRLACFLEDAARDLESVNRAFFLTSLKPVTLGQELVANVLPAKPLLQVTIAGVWLEAPTARLVVSAKVSMAGGIRKCRAFIFAEHQSKTTGQYRWSADSGGELVCWASWAPDALEHHTDIHLIVTASTTVHGEAVAVSHVANVDHAKLLLPSWVALRDTVESEPPPLDCICVLDSENKQPVTLAAWDKARLCAQVRRKFSQAKSTAGAPSLDYMSFAEECSEVIDALETAELREADDDASARAKADLAVAALLLNVCEKEEIMRRCSSVAVAATSSLG